MNTGNSSSNLRMDYNAGVAALQSAGFVGQDLANALLSQSFLRLEQVITTGKTDYKFPILVNDGVQTITEKRLNLQDAIYMSTINIYLCKPSVTTGLESAQIMCSYPNPLIFATTNEATALETIYNGALSFTVNGTVVIPGFDMMSFRQVRQTQLTGIDDSPIDQFDGTDNVIIQPNPIISGQRKNNFNITIPQAVSVISAGCKIVIYVRGVLAQNVTVVS